MTFRFLSLAFMMFCLACCLQGCLAYQAVQTAPQSAFNYPNSNVTPLGPVKVTVKGETKFLGMPLPTGAQDEKLYNAAVKSVDGATMVVDYTKSYKIFEFFPFMWSEMALEGTAVKAEVGKQPLTR